ncbi:hypothetical protein, partial [Stieleria sp.]|uniref:hypothetical protein n=1 Tax=Stieleria sp. TaxID=2795976 RepID=UPI00356A2523
MSDTPTTGNDLRFDSKLGMAERQLERIRREMKHVSGRVRSRHFWTLLAVFAIIAMLFALMFRGAQLSGQIDDATTWALNASVLVIAVVASWVLSSRLAGGVQATASKIETAFPGLGERLLTAAY